MQKFWQNLKNKVSGRNVVGQDKFGNVYYYMIDESRTKQKERRFIDYADKSHPDARAIPLEWNNWLTFIVRDPPTEETSAIIDQKLAERQQINQQRQEEEERMNIQARLSGNGTFSSGNTSRANLMKQFAEQSPMEQESSKPESNFDYIAKKLQQESARAISEKHETSFNNNAITKKSPSISDSIPDEKYRVKNTDYIQVSRKPDFYSSNFDPTGKTDEQVWNITKASSQARSSRFSQVKPQRRDFEGSEKYFKKENS